MIVRRNPDKNFVEEMRQALEANDRYCPCSLVKNDDTKCMCKEFREQIARGEKGYCHCELYYIE